jgi:hypothetical protein
MKEPSMSTAKTRSTNRGENEALRWLAGQLHWEETLRQLGDRADHSREITAESGSDVAVADRRAA